MSAPVVGQQQPGSGKVMVRAKNNPEFDNEIFDNTPVDEVILATGGYDHTIKFWQAHTGVCTRTIPHNDSQVNALCISPDGQLLAACGYQHIKMFDVQGNNANPVVNYEGILKNVMDVGFQDEARWMYTGGEDGTAKIWDLRMRNLNCSRAYATGPQHQPTNTVTSGSANNLSPVNSVKLHPNQQDLIIGDQNGNIHLWDIRSKPESAVIVCPQVGASIQSISIDPQGVYMAAVTNKGSCHMHQLKRMAVPAIIQLAQQQAKEAAPLTCAGAANVAGGSQVVQPTQPGGGPPSQHQQQQLALYPEPKKPFVAHKRYALKCAFSPDSTMLATTSADQTTRLWRTTDLGLITELAVKNQRWVWDVAFSADSQYVLTASSDGIARLWHLPTNEVRKEFQGHTKALTSLAFRDGQAA